MTDEWVLAAQRWVNATYGGVAGYNRCAEDGRTGWGTMRSLTRGLQHELGISPLSDAFGPTTMARLAERGPVAPAYPNSNIIKIVQYGLWCKGYWAGTVNGVYHAQTSSAVMSFRADAGIAGDGVIPTVFRALLNMSAFTLMSGGGTEIREVQRWLNGRYFGRSSFVLVPCDGHFSRDVQTSLLKAIQYELGMSDAQATGAFGPATREGLRSRTVQAGSPEIWLRLFTAACVCNGTIELGSADHSATFAGSWSTALADGFIKPFQRFSVLPVSGLGDYATWCQLLVSTGDPERPVSGCDTRFHIDPARAQALFNDGYRIIGRYLDEDASSTLDKELQPGELDAILDSGLRLFPISQYNGRLPSNFTWTIGQDHATRAHTRAMQYGFPRGTVIYFAVDFDATDAQIDSNVLPYFRGVQSGLTAAGRRYIAGVYGSRNVCQRVSADTYTRFSFVAGMSTGFSGNLGFPMPSNWALNQIKEYTFASAGQSFGLDRNVHRPNSDRGVGRADIAAGNSSVASFLNYVAALRATAVNYGHGNPDLLVLDFLRHPRYTDYKWKMLIPWVDSNWIAYAEQHGPQRRETYTDPSFAVEISVDHLAATASAYFHGGANNSQQGTVGDVGGWAGDLFTFYGEWRNADASYASGYAFCADRLAKLNVTTTYALNDLIEDADGWRIGLGVRAGGRITDLLEQLLVYGGHLRRFRDFYQGRFGGTVTSAFAAAKTMLQSSEWGGYRDPLIFQWSGPDTLYPPLMPDFKLDPFVQGFAEALAGFAAGEA